MLVWMSKEEKQEYDDYKNIIKYEDVCCECGKKSEITDVRKLCLHCYKNEIIECYDCGREIFSKDSYSGLCEECFERED